MLTGTPFTILFRSVSSLWNETEFLICLNIYLPSYFFPYESSPVASSPRFSFSVLFHTGQVLSDPQTTPTLGPPFLLSPTSTLPTVVWPHLDIWYDLTFREKEGPSIPFPHCTKGYPEILLIRLTILLFPSPRSGTLGRPMSCLVPSVIYVTLPLSGSLYCGLITPFSTSIQTLTSPYKEGDGL